METRTQNKQCYLYTGRLSCGLVFKFCLNNKQINSNKTICAIQYLIQQAMSVQKTIAIRCFEAISLKSKPHRT